MLVSTRGLRPIALRRRGRRAADRRAAFAMTAAAAAGGMVVGALLEYFLDPRAGRRRRRTTRDRALSRLRHGERRAVVRARRAESHAVGVARRTVNARRRAAEQPDDVTLAQKVESQLYRRTGIPKGRVSVNAEDGVVFLRGVLERQDDIDRLAEETGRIDGVHAVENLVHMAGTPAPASRTKLERRRTGE